MSKHPEQESSPVHSTTRAHIPHTETGATTGTVPIGNTTTGANEQPGTRQIRFIQDVTYDGGGQARDRRDFKIDDVVDLPHPSADHWVRRGVAVEIFDEKGAADARNKREAAEAKSKAEEKKSAAEARRAAEDAGEVEPATTKDNAGLVGGRGGQGGAEKR